MHNYQWIIFPVPSFIVMYFFYASLLHSIMRLMILSLSPHNLYLLFDYLSTFTLVLLVLKALFCSAIKKDSVYFLKFLLLSYVQIIFLVWFRKHMHIWLSSAFCFLDFLVLMLPLLLLDVVIWLYLLFLVYSSTPWIIVSTQSFIIISLLLSFSNQR